MSAGTPDHYAALNAEIERLRGDPDFERDVDQIARGFGPPPDPEDLVIDDSGYFTACRVDELLAAGELPRRRRVERRQAARGFLAA